MTDPKIIPPLDLLDELSPDGLAALIIKECDGEEPSLDLIQSCIQAGANLNSGGNRFQIFRGETALHVAAAKGYLEVTQLLINGGVSVDIQDSFGWTALQLAASNGHLEVVKELIAAGADLDFHDDFFILTPLQHAAWNGQLECAQALIQAGASLEARDSCDWRALHTSVYFGHSQITKALLNAGAFKGAKNINDQTPWDLASDEFKLQCPELEP